VQAVSDSPTDAHTFTASADSPVPSEPLSIKCDLDTFIVDGQDDQEISSKSSADKSKRSNTASVKFLLRFSVPLFLTFFFQTKLLEWLQYRDTFLLKIMCGYGLGDSQTTDCATCHSRAGKFRCLDCCPHCRLRCGGCLVEIHRENPLHRIEVCFCKSSLLQPD
jgi:hypothetical protein